MYTNRDATELFKRQHARDRMVELAHHVSDDPVDGDVFLSHARAERKGGLLLVGFLCSAIALIALTAVVLF